MHNKQITEVNKGSFLRIYVSFSSYITLLTLLGGTFGSSILKLVVLHLLPEDDMCLI